MKNCQSHHTTHKVEIGQVVLKDTKRKTGTFGKIQFPFYFTMAKVSVWVCALTGLMEESGLICSV